MYLRIFTVALGVFIVTGSLPAWAAKIYGQVKVVDQNNVLKGRQDRTVVFIDGHDGIGSQPVSGRSAAMRQVGKKFIPAVLPVAVGTTVDFPNDDTVFHNVFSLSKANNFDLGLYAQGSSKSATFNAPGLVKVYCNIHPDMVGYVLVLNNPYFGITDESGNFVIEDVPPGKAFIRTWHPYAEDPPEKEIRVFDKDIKDINLSIIENVTFQIHVKPAPEKHKNKWGQDYPSKY